MPVTPGFLGIDEPSAIDKRADTNVVTRAAVVVHREVISLGSADASTPEQIAVVTAANALKVDPSAVQSPVISTDAAGVNQQAITAAGDAKITLDGEQVAISNFPATQPVSAASLPLPSGASTEATLALIKAKTDNLDVPLSAGTAHVRIDNQLAVTGPSGALLATSVIQTDGSQKTKLVDTGGVNVAKVTLGGNLQVSLVASSATVSTVGQETENTAPVNSKNAVLSAKANAANPAWTEGAYVPASVDLSGHLRVDRSAVQPISDNAGSLTVDAPVATPIAARLSDGAAFLTTSGGRLAVDASGVAVPITDNAGSLTVDAPVGTPIAARLSDGAAFYDGAKTGQLPVALVGGRLDENVGAWFGSTAPTVGSKTSVASVPVVIASDQSAVPISVSSLPLPTGSATEVKQDIGNSSLSSLDSKIGTLESKPSTYSVLDRLYQLGLKLDAINKAQALEADLLKNIPPPKIKLAALLIRHPLRGV